MSLGFGHLVKTEGGVLMHISINGLLLRAAERVEKTRDAKYLGWGLRQLLDHIRELRKDPTKVGEFLDLYTDSNPDEKAVA
jgi:hypothetical protein